MRTISVDVLWGQLAFHKELRALSKPQKVHKLLRLQYLLIKNCFHGLRNRRTEFVFLEKKIVLLLYFYEKKLFSDISFQA
jgi:hypothetical protein